MNKTELISAVAEKTEISRKDTEKTINALFDVVMETVSKKEEVVIMGFGTFSALKRKARQARNPGTGETINVPEKMTPKFKTGKNFKDMVERA